MADIKAAILLLLSSLRRSERDEIVARIEAFSDWILTLLRRND